MVLYQLVLSRLLMHNQERKDVVFCAFLYNRPLVIILTYANSQLTSNVFTKMANQPPQPPRSSDVSGIILVLRRLPLQPPQIRVV